MVEGLDHRLPAVLTQCECSHYFQLDINIQKLPWRPPAWIRTDPVRAQFKLDTESSVTTFLVFSWDKSFYDNIQTSDHHVDFMLHFR